MAVIGNNNIISMWYMESDYWANRQSATFGEIDSNYRLTVTPVRTDSKIIFEATLPSQRATHHALNHYAIYNVTDSGYVNLPQLPAGQSRARSHCSSRGQYNADNAVVNVIRTVSDSFSGSKTFAIWCMTYSSDITRHNHSAGNSSGEVHWSSNMVFVAYEVEDI